MKPTLTEFEEFQRALKKVNLNEMAMPIYNGKVIIGENKECYCKMQQILDCPEMAKSHSYILNLDPEQLEEDEIEKVQKLWNLGVNRGFIAPDDENKTGSETSTSVMPAKHKPACSACNADQPDNASWTVLYSACNKDGDIKTGECYSSASSPKSAKADCCAKLAKCGYSNITVLAVEANADGHNDAESSTLLLSKTPAKSASIPAEEFMNAPTVEADTSFDDDDDDYAYSNTRPETDEEFERAEEKRQQDDSDYKSLYSQFLMAADDYQQVVDLNGSDSQAAKNAFAKVKDAYEDCYEVAVEHNEDDERELMSQAMTYGFNLTNSNTSITEPKDEKVDETGNAYADGLNVVDANPQLKFGNSSDISEDDDSDADDADDAESADADDNDSETEDADTDDNSDDEVSDDDSGDTEDSDDDSEEDDVTDDAEDSDEDESSDEDEDSDGEDSDEDETPDDDAEDSDEDSDEDELPDEDSDDEDSDEDETPDDDAEDSDEDADATDDEDSDDDSAALTDEQKTELRNEYKKAFKDCMLKCKFNGKSFDDLSIKEKVEFFQTLGKKWKKNEPTDFMTDKEIMQINKIVVGD